MAGNEYDQDLAINTFHLEKEWQGQPSLFMKYVEMAAEAGKAKDLAKERVDFVKAELDLEIRTKMADDGHKVTEAAVASRIAVHARLREATRNLANKKYEAELLSGAVRAFEQRKSALENLVRLHLSEYFSEPTEDKTTRPFATEALRKAADAKVRERVRDRYGDG